MTPVQTALVERRQDEYRYHVIQWVTAVASEDRDARDYHEHCVMDLLVADTVLTARDRTKAFVERQSFEFEHMAICVYDGPGPEYGPTLDDERWFLVGNDHTVEEH